jgi:Na+-transporting methylmalonyl-CoA/oxaloacetate decarboxylase gamma subunit
VQNGNGISGFTLLVAACIFFPGLFLSLLFFVVLIVIVCMVDSVVKKAVSVDESGKIRLTVPTTAPTENTLSEEKRNEIIQAALAETNRQMAHVVCPDRKFRERYFETVFTRLCERQGLNAAEIVRKRTKV